MHTVKTICICGAGTMGSGIAQVCAQALYKTIVYDSNEVMLCQSRENIWQGLQVLINKNKIAQQQAEEIFAAIFFTTNIQECHADLIIEAIIEDEKIKSQLFTALASINSAETIFATNTSSLQVTRLAENMPCKERFAGMHFFNPAPVMKLVEIVQTKFTSIETIDTIKSVALRMNKTPVICKDEPGFIVNRVARPYYLEALRLAEQGARVETVDAVMEASGFKMGPFRLMDLIGMDINYAVSNLVWEQLGKPARLQPSRLQKEKTEKNELGRKTKKGFYKYD